MNKFGSIHITELYNTKLSWLIPIVLGMNRISKNVKKRNKSQNKKEVKKNEGKDF